ncbi:MAG: tol-pal system-associated acyl-CoA thioesterase [Pseudomonadota bacterium]
MTAHRLDLSVYYEDTDMAGIVYYANYLKYIERGRTEALNALGIDQLTLKAEAGLVFVVRWVGIDYLIPAKFGDRLTVATVIGRVRGASIDMMQEVQRGDQALIRASVTLACMDDAGRPQRLPDAIRLKLAAAAAS